MPPKRRCSCKQHLYCSTLFPDDEEIVQRLSDKKIRVKVINFLMKREFIFPHSTFLCNLCVKFAEQCLQHEDDTEEAARKKKFSIVEYFEEFLQAVSCNQLTSDQLSSLSYALGKTQAKATYEDTVKCGSQYKDVDYLETFNLKDWLLERNQVIVNFIKGVCNNNCDEIRMAKTVESIYGCRNNYFVSPMSFSQNLLGYYITGSKSALIIGCKGSPSGSYTTVQNWISEQSKDAIECPQNSDVVTFFDNNQVLEKKWKVEVNYKSKASVITTMVHIIPDSESHIQHIPELSPRHWMKFTSAGKKDTINKMKDLDLLHFETFRHYRNEFIKDKLEKIVNNQDENGLDNIDKNLLNISYIRAEERYSFIKSKHSKTPTVVMGEPCFENPCSYEAVEKVLDHIREKTKVGEDRKWTMVGCDGLPYTLASRIIENMFTCPDCGMDFMDKPDFMDHIKNYDHALNIDTDKCRKYNDIVMLPGLGHYEINMTKAIFRLLWDVILIDLAKLLGFNSPKAQASFMSATDHHKSWQIFQIFLQSMAAELLLVYVRDPNTSSPSVNGFYEWYVGVKNPNYKFMAEVVFSYCLALHVFRAGVRRNNSTAINASKTKFSSLFFGLNMPFYMETYMRDSFVRIQCPGKVRGFIEEHESYRVSGSDAKGEGGDFILEAKNRKTKMWIQNGVPDEEKWRNVCRCIDKLEKVRENLSAALCICELDAEYSYMYNIDFEINCFRQSIRASAYINDPFKEKCHTSFSGKPLDGALKDFHLNSLGYREEFVNFLADHSLNERKKFPPLFILADERSKAESIVNKTKSEIIKIIECEVEKINTEKINTEWKKVKSKAKADILKFYHDFLKLEEGND